MAYIGQKVKATLMNDRVVDTMTGDGSDTTLELSSTPISINNTLVFINGIYQRQTTDYTLSGTTITFTEAPFSGAIVCAITGGGEHIGCPMTPMGADKLIDGIATDSKIVGMSASKLSGTLPALDGSALTGINNSISTIAVDPTITTNPADGVGTLIINSASGEMYVCTDATADNNIWTNVGGGSGNIEPWLFGGTVAGYAASGYTDNSLSSVLTINKFLFSSNVTASGHGDLSAQKWHGTGHQSKTHGYAAGGQSSYGTGHGVPASTDSGTTIQKYAFASNVTAESHGDVRYTRYGVDTGNTSATDGFQSGGSGYTTTIDKFSLTTNTTSADHGSLESNRTNACSQSSDTEGFTSGGQQEPSWEQLKSITKFSFTSNTTSAGHGDLTTAYGRTDPSGCSSKTHGYACGGHSNGTPSTIVDEFSFSSNVTAASHSNLTRGVDDSGGVSSTTHGFAVGGRDSESTIDTFSFSSTANATDHGDLLNTKQRHSCSQQ